MADLQLSLSSIIHRLENAVSRLESVDTRFPPLLSAHAVPDSSTPASSLPSSFASLDPAVSAFDSLIQSDINRVLSAAEKIGGQVLQGSQVLKEAFVAERNIVLAISKCKQPDINNLQKLVQPLANAISKAVALTEGRRLDAYNHLKVIAESLTSLTWVVFTDKDCGMSFPATHVEESWQAAEFYNNKVLVEYRNKDANHAEWARAMKQLFLPALRDYTKKFHLTGPAWNTKGVGVDQFSANSFTSASSSVPRGALPPPPQAPSPPQPPPLGTPSAVGDVAGGSRSSMNAVFQQINKGEGVTSGLRKVTDNMKTKNRADRFGTVPAGTSSVGSNVGGATSFAGKASHPKFELQMDRK